MVLNPVRAGLVVHPKAWKWSSYRVTAGYESPEPSFECDCLLKLFHTNRRNAREAYRRFVNEGVLIKESPLEKAVGSLVLGGAEFQASVRELVKGRKTGEFKNEQVELTKPDPGQIIRAVAKLYGVKNECILKVDRRRNEARDLTAWCMRRLGCLSLSKVGHHLGVQYSTAGHAVSRMNKKMAKDPRLLKKVQKAVFQT